MKKVVCVIQARMNSSRLPGKVLTELVNSTVLATLLQRVRASKSVSEIRIATTTDAIDDLIEEFCQVEGIACHRGSESDVLSRFLVATRDLDNNDLIVRITGDCPLLDPNEIDICVTLMEQKDVDFVSNRLPPPFSRTLPVGLDVEVVKVKSLRQIDSLARKNFEREHVMPYIYMHPEKYSKHIFEPMIDYSNFRWTLDTPQDLIAIRRLLELSTPGDFRWRSLLRIAKLHPEIGETNSNSKQKMLGD